MRLVRNALLKSLSVAALSSALLPLGQNPAGAATSPAPTQAQAHTQAQAIPSMPSWVLPEEMERDSTQGVTDWRGCTGIRISGSRELTGADCFTGRTADIWDSFNPATHRPDSGGGGYAYRLAPGYQATTRQNDLGVHIDLRANQRSTAAPVLAGPRDGALYAPGTTATFYSWVGDQANSFAPRTAHIESAVVRSPSTCSMLLGHPLPAGMLCTSPAPGVSVPAQDRCVGDDGGALVAGGKLIGVGATPAKSCSATGVRLYTSVAFRHQLIQSWGTDVYAYGLMDGALTVLKQDRLLTGFCDSHLTCVDQYGGEADTSGQYNLVLEPGDLNGDGYGDLILRTNDGRLYAYLGFHDGAGSDLTTGQKVYLGSGWNAYTSVLAPGDVSGDGYPDLLARDRAGVLWLYPGNTHGGFGSRVRVGGGWNIYNLLAAHGDLNGDGVADLLARDQQGRLWVYPGNGHGGFGTRRLVGWGWQIYNALSVVGDLNGQGGNQLVGRLPSGQLYLDTGNGHGGFGPRQALPGNRWLRYAILT